MRVHHKLKFWQFFESARRRQVTSDAQPWQRADAVREDRVEQDARWLFILALLVYAETRRGLRGREIVVL